jgi:hypothetical protein
MLQRTGEAETITTHYLFALGLIERCIFRTGYTGTLPKIVGAGSQSLRGSYKQCCIQTFLDLLHEVSSSDAL